MQATRWPTYTAIAILFCVEAAEASPCGSAALLENATSRSQLVRCIGVRWRTRWPGRRSGARSRAGFRRAPRGVGGCISRASQRRQGPSPVIKNPSTPTLVDAPVTLRARPAALVSPARYLCKRALDVSVAAVLLVLLAPVLAVAAVCIKLDSPGPVVFRQWRIGKHGQPFQMLKFRTMITDRRKRNVGPPPGVRERRRVHKSSTDPRVTRVRVPPPQLPR